MVEWQLHGPTKSWHVDRPLVMAIVNATPDSFSDGGTLPSGAALRAHLKALIAAGADILDIGGESTRPGHNPVPVDEELARVLPVIKAASSLGVPVSIDSQKPAVAEAALEAGAHFINDVSGGVHPAMLQLAATSGCSIVLMRRENLTGTPTEACRHAFLALEQRAMDAGVEHIILDPGLGFGDPPGADPVANLALLDAPSWTRRPVLIGASRKRFVGALAGGVAEAARDAQSASVAVDAVQRGAAIVRVHNVEATRQALD